MQIVAVRHGRTAWNAVRRFQGQTDVPLDAEGRAQAQALAVHLAPERFDVAIASTLGRAWETAQAICAHNGSIIEPEPRLREMQFGEWEGLTWDEIVVLRPELAHADGKTPRVFVPRGGESFDEVCARVAPVLDEITARLGAHERALIVSHAGIMHAMLRVALGESAAEALGVRFEPAGIMRLQREPGEAWQLEAINEIAPALADSGASGA